MIAKAAQEQMLLCFFCQPYITPKRTGQAPVLYFEVGFLPKKKVCFSVPVPPSENHCFITIGNKRILSKEARLFMTEAALKAKIAARREGWKIANGRKVVLQLYFFFPNKRKKDTHNTLKVLMDSFEGILYENDYWALPRVMDFDIDRENSRLDIEVFMK